MHKRLVISDGTLELVKWIALVLMTFDHINKYIFSEKYTVLFDMGRVVMPLFAFILAYNLARENMLESGGLLRVVKRLAFFGAISTPIFVMGGGLLFGVYPLNILFLLCVGAVVILLSEKGGWRNIAVASVVFVLCGALVEFWHIGLLFMLASYYYAKNRSAGALVVMTLSAASLYLINHNFFALIAIPAIMLMPFIKVNIKRVGRFFYWYYPIHLGVVISIKYILQISL